LDLKKIKTLDFNNLKKILNSDISSLKNINKKSKTVQIDSKIKPKNTKYVISLDIGTNKIKVVVGKYSKNKIIIKDIFLVNTPKGIINDGNILNNILMSETLQNIYDLCRIKTKTKNVNCIINSTSIINREILIPAAEEDELDTLVKYEIAQYLPINLEDYILQYNLIEEIKQDEINKFKVLVVTYPDKLAKQYYEALLNAKLIPNALDITFNSLKKLLYNTTMINESEYNIKDTVAFIDMGANTLNINIYTNGQMDFTRIVKSGGNFIDNEISKNTGVSLKEGEEKKIKYCNLNGLFKENTEEFLIDKIIKEIIDEWIDELNRIIQFYKNKKVGNKIDKIYIYGGSSNLNGIDIYLNSKLNIPVEKVTTFNNIVLDNNIEKNDLNLYINAIGAIIRF